jgi:hypothetical protein
MWEIDMDSRPDGGLRDEFDVSARLLYEAVDLRKTEPGTLFDVLRRAERLEGMRVHFRDHACACI